MNKPLIDLLESTLIGEVNECVDMITKFYHSLSDDYKPLVLDKLLVGRLRKDIQSRLLVQPLDPRDHFMVSLSNLREDGDIEHLVRSLNWMDDDLRYYKRRVDLLEGEQKIADKLRVEVARLKDSNNALREKNAQLKEQLKQFKYGKKKF